jgi:hypothetical protein
VLEKPDLSPQGLSKASPHSSFEFRSSPTYNYVTLDTATNSHAPAFGDNCNTAAACLRNIGPDGNLSTANAWVLSASGKLTLAILTYKIATGTNDDSRLSHGDKTLVALQSPPAVFTLQFNHLILLVAAVNLPPLDLT